jgi:hypothetical protein
MGPRTIWLHRAAPAKPEAGAPCNGCGVCCAAEPCPVGMLLSLRVRGRCRLLRFEDSQARYRCGLMPAGHAVGAVRWLRLLVARWIGAGLGCDSTAQAIAAPRRPALVRPH